MHALGAVCRFTPVRCKSGTSGTRSPTPQGRPAVDVGPGPRFGRTPVLHGIEELFRLSLPQFLGVTSAAGHDPESARVKA